MTKKVVKTLQKIIKDNDLKFNKYITIDYHKVDNLDKVISDNKRLRYVIRKFYKSNIRFWFFTEVHRNGKLKGISQTHTYGRLFARQLEIPIKCYEQLDT